MKLHATDPLDRMDRLEALLISIRRILYVLLVLNLATALILYWPGSPP